MTVKLRKDSQISAYMAYPRFLLTADLSETAKLVYLLLLDRARLSMKNEGWEDEQGHVFTSDLIKKASFDDSLPGFPPAPKSYQKEVVLTLNAN